jgi:L-ascorbate metabolism protein UlaG (beta-lactamase superfamily)
MPAAPSITWSGHATVLIELDGVRILTDPVLRRRVGMLTRIAEPVPADTGQRIDAVLLSHLHADHADLPSLRRVAASAPVIAPRGSGTWLSARGLANVQEIGAGEEVNIGPVVVSATPAEHDGRRLPVGGGAVAEAIGFVVRGSRALYFAGDTDLFPEMAELDGTIDVALLPIWGWGPTLGPGHLDPRRAAEAAALIDPKVVVPIHWGTLAVGRPARRPRDPMRPAREFASLAAQLAPGVEVCVLAPGERMELPVP